LERRKHLKNATSEGEALALRRAYADRLAAAGLTPMFLVDITKPAHALFWRVELVTDDAGLGEGCWLRALPMLNTTA